MNKASGGRGSFRSLGMLFDAIRTDLGSDWLILDQERTGYGRYLWIALRSPAGGMELRLYIIRNNRSTWSLVRLAGGDSWVNVPSRFVSAAT